MTADKIEEGELDFQWTPAGKECKTWYRIVGDLAAGVPLIILHGGPGMASDYMFPVADLWSQCGRPVIFYDQIGTGRSTHLQEKKNVKDFWTMELFIAELENLIQALNLGVYDALGQSWGGMLGSTWAATKQPRGLRKLILSNSPASIDLWVQAADELRKGLPKETQDILSKHEEAGTYDSDEYTEAVMAFYARHLCRKSPMPKPLMDTLEWIEYDNTVYFTMNGPSEFHVIGTIRDWSIIDKCEDIKVPTLLINGKYDEAKDATVRPFFKNIPKVKWITLDNESHCPMLENLERYLEVVDDFLKD